MNDRVESKSLDEVSINSVINEIKRSQASIALEA